MIKLDDCKKCLKHIKIAGSKGYEYVDCRNAKFGVLVRNMEDLKCPIDKVIIKTKYYTAKNW